MEPQLPPGWTAQWDAQANRYLYIDTATNHAQWEEPTHQPSPQPSAASPPPPTTTHHNPRRRQYPAAQMAYETPAVAAPSPVSAVPYGQPAVGGQGQMFTPGLAAQQQPAAAGQGYFAPAAQPMVGQPQIPALGQVPGQAQQGYVAPGAAGYGGVQGVTEGMRGMGMGDKLHPLHTINLIGMQPDVRTLDTPPPPILLPAGACISPHPTAQADPSYQRSTINAIPTTASLLNKSKLPLALILTPYRSLKPGDEPVPVVSDTVIARCRRCRSYINPYVTFIEGGARWKCCMCNLSNEVPQLFDWNAQTNQPADRWTRAELNHGVVEFVAPAEYMIRAPQPPVYVFIIDVSQNAIQSGMVATAARTILESLDRLPNADDRTKIGFIAVSSSLHFFSLPPGQAEPSMLVVSDIDDVYLPKPTDLLVNLTESRAAIESFLGRVSDMFKDSFTQASAVGPAMQAAHKLIGTIGGKIITLTATLPTVGEGALKARDDAKLLGTAKESTLLQAASSFYKTFSIECARNQVTVDMFLFSPQYTDVASLRCLPRYTGGQVYYYPGFNAGRSEDAIKFATEFGTVLASPIGLEAVIRVRGSRGLRMSAFHGNFFTRSTDLLSLPTVPIDQSYAIELQIEDPLTQPVVVLQTAVLHTTCYGERRIRVMTTALPTTTSMSEVFASADQNAIVTLLANKAVERAMTSKLEDARDAVINKLVDVLKVYKDTMTSAGGGASAQLAIPENLKMLPLLCCGLVKHVGLRESTQIPPDLRAYAHALLTTLPTESLLAYLHPRFYSLHNMPADAGTIGEQGVIMPPALNLTSERLERHGLYLIEDGQNMFLYVGQDAVPQLIMDVFDLASYQELKGGKYTLPVLDNSFSQRVNAIIAKTRELRRNPYWPHLYVVKADAEPALRNWALSMLIEDRVDRSASYGQFLSLIKDKVNS
ncbi:COPII subunit [Naganishia albida]|nr:COPII subunit [Naganishia albida]